MLSGPVLIARGLDLKTGASRYGVLKVCGDTPLTTFGGHSDGGTPLPIPNREVKPVSADGTRRATSRESRSPPIFLRIRARLGPFFVDLRRLDPLLPVRIQRAEPDDALGRRWVRREERREPLN